MLKMWLPIAVMSAALSAYAQTIERPIVKVGDECVFDVFDDLNKDGNGNPTKIAEAKTVVASLDGDRIVYNWTHKILVARDTDDLEDGAWIVDKDLNVVDRNGRKFDPPYPSRIYPLTPGAERKSVKSAFPRPQRDGDTSVTFDGKASSWESITVPAGKFDSITVTWEGSYSTAFGLNRLSGRLYQQVSYSPATSCLISGTYRTHRSVGTVLSSRTYKLTSHKN